MNKKTLIGKDFHFGIGFLNELLDGLKIRLDELGSIDDAILVPKMMFYSLVYSCKRRSKEIDFDMNSIFDLIDENGGVGGQFWIDFNVAFYESMNKNVPADTSKKKATAKK